MKSKRSAQSSPDRTLGNVLDDLGFSPSETLEIRIKAEIYRELVGSIRERELSAAQTAKLLGLHQPDVSNLMTGRISKFSVGKLIKLAGRMNLGAEIKLTRPEAATVSVEGTASTRKQAAATVAQ